MGFLMLVVLGFGLAWLRERGLRERVEQELRALKEKQATSAVTPNSSGRWRIRYKEGRLEKTLVVTAKTEELAFATAIQSGMAYTSIIAAERA